MTERLAYYQQRNLEFGEAEALIKNWLQIKHEIMSLRSPAGPRRRRKRTHAIGVHPLPPAVLSVTILLAAQDCAVAGGGKAPVSACKLLCAIFLRKPRVYPLSSVKASVGRLCEKLKSGLKSGWEIKFMVATLQDFLPLLMVMGHREPGNVCI